MLGHTNILAQDKFKLAEPTSKKTKQLIDAHQNSPLFPYLHLKFQVIACHSYLYETENKD